MARKNELRSRSLGALAALLLVAGQMAAAAPVSAQNLTFVKLWSQTVSDGSPISSSSPNLATLGGASAVVVGDQGGHIYAFSLASGAAVPGWPASTGGVPVDSTPSVRVGPARLTKVGTKRSAPTARNSGTWPCIARVRATNRVSLPPSP